jgi:hypothetical protein
MCARPGLKLSLAALLCGGVFYAGCGAPSVVLSDTVVPGPEGPAGGQGPAGDAGATGATGATGPAGLAGDYLIYGDGSAGPLALTGAGTRTLYVDTAANHNLQFTDFTLGLGSTLAVPSGTVIRCTGTFTLNGTISVTPVDSVAGASHDLIQATTLPNFAGAGVSGSIAEAGVLGVSSDNCTHGRGAQGLSADEARTVVMPGLIGGGGGAGGFSGSGGAGGGTLVVLARTAIGVGATGTITANGGNADIGCGGGGGGGGVVVLASPGSVTNSGFVVAVGGKGGDSGIQYGAGGGGGGGIVQLLSPTITAGLVIVTGGAAGAHTSHVTSTPRIGGGGGGACGGAGGNGGDIASGANVIPAAAQAGFTGYTLQTPMDPTALFH